MKKTNNHGGKRREGVTQTKKTFGIDNDLLPFLEEQKNKSRFINDLIRGKMKTLLLAGG